MTDPTPNDALVDYYKSKNASLERDNARLTDERDYEKLAHAQTMARVTYWKGLYEAWRDLAKALRLRIGTHPTTGAENQFCTEYDRLAGGQS